MLTTTIITDITSEDFEVPVTTFDLGELIETSCDVYSQLPLNRGERKLWRNKLNDLIDEYNDRRQCSIYHHLK